jgi:hypothetical protein
VLQVVLVLVQILFAHNQGFERVTTRGSLLRHVRLLSSPWYAHMPIRSRWNPIPPRPEVGQIKTRLESVFRMVGRASGTSAILLDFGVAFVFRYFSLPFVHWLISDVIFYRCRTGPALLGSRKYAHWTSRACRSSFDHVLFVINAHLKSLEAVL